MTIHAIIHSTEVENSYPIDFNGVTHFIEIDIKNLLKQIDNETIKLDEMTSFFLQDKNTGKIFRIYVADFRQVGKFGFVKIEEYLDDPKLIKISGTISFV